MEQVELWSFWRSSASYRIRIALAHKGIAYTYRTVNLLTGAHHDPEYVKLNPMHSIPTLYINGHYLNQSMAILEYLEETHPAHPLLPKDPYQRHLARQIAQIIIADTQPLQTLKVMKMANPNDAAARDAWAKHWISAGLKAVEEVLAKCAGRCSVGDEISVADCCIVPQVYNARRFSIDMTQFPVLTRIESALNELPAFKQAHPNAQPDRDPEGK